MSNYLPSVYKPVYRIETDKPVAYDSPDHIEPRGTKDDNSVNLWYNRKLFAWLGRGIAVLDIGCSGGGFVKSVLDAGCLGIGVEGSDYSLKHQRAEWATIPRNLFTADATEPFTIYEDTLPLKFDVITSWEVIEHIAEGDLPAFFDNIDRHLEPNGVVVLSISPLPEIVNGVTLHQTVQPREWWLKRFDELGWKHHGAALRWFGDDFVRNRYNAPNSFNVVLTRKGDNLPSVFKLRLLLGFVAIPLAAVRFVKIAVRKVLVRSVST